MFALWRAIILAGIAIVDVVGTIIAMARHRLSAALVRLDLQVLAARVPSVGRRFPWQQVITARFTFGDFPVSRRLLMAISITTAQVSLLWNVTRLTAVFLLVVFPFVITKGSIMIVLTITMTMLASS